MKLKQKLLAGMFVMSAFAPLALLPIHAQAQQSRAYPSNPHIDGFNVDEVRRLSPGVELEFGLYGTPGGQATLRIAGAIRNLNLVEVEPGQYEGTYTISSRDKIAARSPVTANLRVGNLVASAVLEESLQSGVGYHRPNPMPGPQPHIEQFNVESVSELSDGNDLHFRVLGTPGGKVDLDIAGVKGKVFLSEVKEGEYANVYTIRGRDRITPNSTVTANLRIGDRVVSSTLGKSLQSVALPQAVRVVHACNSCGKVDSINQVEVKGEGNYLGTIGGGVIGALLGSQVGGGNGRTAAEVAGAVGGAYAGNAIQGNARKAIHYEVSVLFENGARQTITFPNDPGYRIGDNVRVRDGVISRNP